MPSCLPDLRIARSWSWPSPFPATGDAAAGATPREASGVRRHRLTDRFDHNTF
jgi:hypothetical protein